MSTFFYADSATVDGQSLPGQPGKVRPVANAAQNLSR